MIVMPTPFWVDLAAPTQGAAGVRVSIDPTTGKILPGTPAASAQWRMDGDSSKTIRLRQNAEGVLYLDTSQYRMEMRVQLTPEGEAHVNCNVASHGHPSTTTSAGNDIGGENRR